MESLKCFDELLFYLPKEIAALLKDLPYDIKEKTTEIRLRANKPLALSGLYGTCFPYLKGRYSFLSYEKTPVISASQIENTVISLCSRSVYTHQEEINRGFISFGNGFRAGVSGVAVTENGNIQNVRSFSSVNMRIARNFSGCADDIADRLFKSGLCNAVIFGEPMSGKTTALKDIARILSSEPNFYRTVIADERCEMKFADGVNLDFFCGYPKKTAIEYAVRAFSPQIMICDELGSSEECRSVLSAVDCGVKFILTVHCSSVDELKRRSLTKLLIECGSFDKFVHLKGIGKKAEIYSREELYAQIHGDDSCSDCIGIGRDLFEFSNNRAGVGA